HRPGGGRISRWVRAEVSVLGVSNFEFGESTVWIVRLAGVAPERAKIAVQREASESAWRAEAAAFAPGIGGTRSRNVSLLQRARIAAQHVRAVHRLPLPFQPSVHRIRVHGGRRRLDDRVGVPDFVGDQETGGSANAIHRLALRVSWFRGAGCGADNMDLT